MFEAQARGEILTFPDTPTTQGLSLWCFNTVGGEILTFPDTPTTQRLSLWCFNTVRSTSTSRSASALRLPACPWACARLSPREPDYSPGLIVGARF